ncbi:MAG: NADPH:quinone oxidoreductase family protein [Pseudomonadota bacterium]
MRALLCEAYGPPQSLTVVDLPDPAAGAGEVLVEVIAAGLNFFDTLLIRGKYQVRPEPPFSPGGELVGRVIGHGPGVDAPAIGTRVVAYSTYGACRERIALPASSVVPVPDGISDEAAAGLLITYGTTYHALKDRARLQRGETLVVLGASGGVGLAAVELGKAMGARVIACATSEEKLASAMAHGADDGVNYGTGDLKAALKAHGGATGIDVVYDPVGGELAEAALRSLGWKGRFLVIGFASGTIPKMPLNLALLKGCDILGVFWGRSIEEEPDGHRANVAELLALCETGKLKTRIDSVLSLDEAPLGLEKLSDRKAVGKIIVRID